jgi:hypothetical protein
MSTASTGNRFIVSGCPGSARTPRARGPHASSEGSELRRRPHPPRRQKSFRDYFVGEGRMPWWTVCFSVVATETSVFDGDQPARRRVYQSGLREYGTRTRVHPGLPFGGPGVHPVNRPPRCRAGAEHKYRLAVSVGADPTSKKLGGA